MRTLMAVVLAAVSLHLGAATAEASCIQQTLAEQAERADVVAFGRVSGNSFEIRQVLKGQAGGTVQVRFGEGGPGVVTSVDYMNEPGDHTLYLRRDGSGYATNACSGSHPGVPTGDERAFFGAGEVATSDGGSAASGGPVGLAAGLIAASLVALALIKLRRRATS